MSVFKRKKRFHFVGIGGIGMSGLAEILLDMGHAVSGSDREWTEITEYLEQRGARVFRGHHYANVADDVDFLIYSSAVPQDNPELRAAREKGIPQLKRAQLLGQLFNRHFGLAVAGTHGKTTTTSMIGQIMITGGLDPTIVVGGRLHNLMTNARLGKSHFMVTEADEYDRSFLTLFPRMALLTSLEADHLDIYEDLDDLRRTFVKFANQVSFDGLVIVCAEDENLKELIPQIQPEVLTYGFGAEADFRACVLEERAGQTRFEVYHRGERLAELTLNVPGKHNVLNALAALVAGLELDIEISVMVKALAEFKGVERRFDVLAEKDGILVVDDYAHHPTEVAVTLQAARDGWNKRLIAVFQPHLFSRTRDFYREFAQALNAADVVIVSKIYPAREAPIAGVNGALIANEVGDKARYIAQEEALLNFLEQLVQANDMILFLGAGDIHYTAQKFARLLVEKK
ncbi:UDP-N-acetylmuramate--L-alanine ligase [Caldithrix abyssi]